MSPYDGISLVVKFAGKRMLRAGSLVLVGIGLGFVAFGFFDMLTTGYGTSLPTALAIVGAVFFISALVRVKNQHGSPTRNERWI